MRLLSIFLVQSICFGCFSESAGAQKKEIFYDQAWKPTTVENARYYSVVEKTDSGYLHNDYYLRSGGRTSLQMQALYEDEAGKIGNGYASYFHPNGNLQHSFRKIHGKTEGDDISLYPNGYLRDSAHYADGKRIGVRFTWHENGYTADSLVAINDSMEVQVNWFDDGVPAGAGYLLRGKKHGVWGYNHHNGSKSSIEKYEAGKLVTAQFYDETGIAIKTDTSKIEQPPVFKGGLAAYRRYLENALEWPRDFHLKNTTSVVLNIQMTLDENGKATNVSVLDPFDPAFDSIAIKAIQDTPKWTPAKWHNRFVKYRFTQLVTFRDDQ